MVLSELNKLSLEDARKEIIKNAAEQKKKLEDEIANYKSRLEEAFRSMNKARADGDASENASLDDARKNVSQNQTAITACQERLDDFETITDRDYRLYEFDEELFYQHLNSGTSEFAQEFKSLVAQFDNMRSFSSFKFKNLYNKYCQAKGMSTDDLDLLEDLRKLNYCLQYNSYNSTGLVLMYSAVRVEVSVQGKQPEIITAVCFPGQVSNIEQGILSVETLLYKLIVNSDMQHPIKRYNNIQYTIKDIY